MSLPDIKPLIVSVRCQPFDGADWLFEPKYDGYRALLYVEPGRASLVSRNGHVFGRFDKLAASIAATLKANAGSTAFDAARPGDQRRR